jgi:aminoglycoside phosphotransferase (APT) family kinase protein
MKLELVPGDTHAALADFTAVFDRKEFHAAVDRLAEERGWGAPLEVRVQPLKAHRHRCTFDLAIRTGAGQHPIIGKAYRRDRVDIFEAMDAFRRAGFGPDAAFSIPEPLAHVASISLRLEERVPGASAQDVLLSGDLDARLTAARRCGAWLGHFHTTAPRRLGKRIDLEAEARRWEEWAAQMAGAGEPFARKAPRLLQWLCASLPSAATVVECAAHGSYIPDHLILSDGRAAAIDLDQYGVGDPAREVAWFLISLRRMAMKHVGDFHAMDGAAPAFLDAYGAVAGPVDRARTRFYAAVECLHRGRRDLLARTPPQSDWAETMLDEALREVA